MSKPMISTLLTIAISTQPLLGVLSLPFTFLNNSILGTNLGSVLSLIVVVVSFIILGAVEFQNNSKINLKFFVPFLAISLISTIYGFLGQQSWLVSLGMILIQLSAGFLKLSKEEFWRTCLYSLILVTILLLILSLQFPILEDCRSDKCLIFSKVLSGSVGGNGLGLDLYTILVFTLFLREVTIFDGMIFASLSMLYMLETSSRTGIFLFAVAVTLFATKKIIIRLHFEKLILIAAVAYSTYPIWGNYSESALTERGYLWAFARSIIDEAGLIGFGPSYWTHLGDSLGFPANYGTHNMWLDVTISFGKLGLILFVIILVAVFKSISRPFDIILLTCLILSGMNESTFILWKLYPNSVLLLLLIASNSALQRGETKYQR